MSTVVYMDIGYQRCHARVVYVIIGPRDNVVWLLSRWWAERGQG